MELVPRPKWSSQGLSYVRVACHVHRNPRHCIHRLRQHREVVPWIEDCRFVFWKTWSEKTNPQDIPFPKHTLTKPYSYRLIMNGLFTFSRQFLYILVCFLDSGPVWSSPEIWGVWGWCDFTTNFEHTHVTHNVTADGDVTGGQHNKSWEVAS